jgi:hypothetical protein
MDEYASLLCSCSVIRYCKIVPTVTYVVMLVCVFDTRTLYWHIHASNSNIMCLDLLHLTVCHCVYNIVVGTANCSFHWQLCDQRKPGIKVSENVYCI